MIYLVDTIGEETGMHLYDEAFVKEMQHIGVNAIAVSNYEDSYSIPVLKNFYRSSKVDKISMLILSWLKMLFFYSRHWREIFVYQSFGLRYIDMLFVLIFFNKKRLFVIVHDVVEITNGNGQGLGIKYKLQKWVYRHCVTNVICHSNQSENDLKNIINFKGNVIRFPHFRYHFNKNFKLSLVDKTVIDAIDKSKTNCLFFGQLRETKGIDILKNAIEELRGNNNINIIIAGQDKDDMMNGVTIPNNTKCILRRINDDEMSFLFSSCDMVLLPYKEIYQSGVLETVIHFGKYAIMSDCVAFKEVNDRYPSFGTIYKPNSGYALAECIKQKAGENFDYSVEDNRKYDIDHNAERLVVEMEKLMHTR